MILISMKWLEWRDEGRLFIGFNRFEREGGYVIFFRVK